MSDGAGPAETFIPLLVDVVTRFDDFELLTSLPDVDTFSQIERSRDWVTDKPLSHSVADVSAAPLPVSHCDPARTQDAENAALKERLSELAAEVESLKANERTRHEQSVDAEMSTLRQSFSSVCDGLQPEVTGAVCQEIARILEPFLEQTLLGVTLNTLESEMSKLLDSNSEDFFVLSGPKDAMDKFAPLLEGNKFRFKLNFSGASEVTVEYRNQLLSTRFDHWERLLRQETLL